MISPGEQRRLRRDLRDALEVLSKCKGVRVYDVDEPQLYLTPKGFSTRLAKVSRCASPDDARDIIRALEEVIRVAGRVTVGRVAS